MKVDKTFTDALARFKTADSDVARITVKLHEAIDRQMQFSLDLAQIDREIESFTSSGNIDAASAAKLVSRKTEASNMLTLLDSSIDQLQNQLALAKADVFKAERECADAQVAYHDATVDELCSTFLRNNTETIRKIMLSLHRLSVCATARTGNIAEGTQQPIPHIAHLFNRLLPAIAAKEFDGVDFAENAATKTQPIEQFHVSANISSAERSALAHKLGQSREQNAQALLDLLKPEEDEPFDMSMAMTHARNAAQQASHHRERVQFYKARREVRPGDNSIEQYIRLHADEADKFDLVVANWDARIQAHRMAA